MSLKHNVIDSYAFHKIHATKRDLIVGLFYTSPCTLLFATALMGYIQLNTSIMIALPIAFAHGYYLLARMNHDRVMKIYRYLYEHRKEIRGYAIRLAERILSYLLLKSIFGAVNRKSHTSFNL